jgi:hypothetical protein
LHGDLLCRFRRLHRERFHLGSDHGETATRFAGPRRLDRCIERKQVCLAGNVTDQIDDFADVLNGVDEARL